MKNSYVIFKYYIYESKVYKTSKKTCISTTTSKLSIKFLILGNVGYN